MTEVYNTQKTIVILTHVEFDNSPYCIFVHEHAKALVKQGYNVVVLAVIHWLPIVSNFQKHKKNFMKEFKKENKIQIINGVKVIYIKSISFSNLLYNSKINLNGYSYYRTILKTFDKIIKENNVIGIDAHTFKVEGYVASKLKRKYNIMTTVTLHGTSFFRNAKTRNGIKCINKILNKVDYTICVSDKIKKIAESCGVKNTKIIYNGINQYISSNVNKYIYQIVSVGSLIPRKKYDITINVIGRLSKEYPEIKLKIIGIGSEMEFLEKMVVENGIEKNVEFKRQLPNEDVFNIMEESNIFILPSIDEGFGIVYAEAMNAKCITIGTKGEGIDGFIKNGENGFLVNPNVDEIVNLIREIYNNKYNLDEIRIKAYNDSKNLTWNTNAQEYVKLFLDNK